MFLAIIFSIACCLTSFMIHLNYFVVFFHPTDRLLSLISFYAVLILLYPNVWEMQRIIRKCGKVNYWKLILDICPKWMIFTAGILLLYALGNFVYYLLFTHTALASEEIEKQIGDVRMRTLSSLWLAMHFLILTLLYDLWHLKKHGHPLLDSCN
ncbi:MAG: hypothetical protein WC374_01690 [Phycisphaerae bacterium]|jgi:hypothetical protein